jgi:hypothetical protein
VGIGIGLIDMGGGFEWFYKYLDNAENEHNNPSSVGDGKKSIFLF